MNVNDRSNKNAESSQEDGSLSRRAVLMTATVAAGALAAAQDGLADTVSTGNFGAPVVELYVPAGVLTLEQRGAMIKGISDVVFKAMKLQPDPAHRLFVEIIETAEGGFGVNGQVFVPAKK